MKIVKFVCLLFMVCILGCEESEAEPVSEEQDAKPKQEAIVGIGITQKNDPGRREIAHKVYKNIIDTLSDNGKGYSVSARWDPGDVTEMAPILSLGSVFVYVGHGAVKRSGDDSAPEFQYHGFVCDTGVYASGTNVITPSDINASVGRMRYKLVFINGCFTCEQSPESKRVCESFRTRFNADTYVGWKNEIDVSKLYYGNMFVKALMSGKSVEDAITHVKNNMNGHEPEQRYFKQQTQDGGIVSLDNDYKAYLGYVGSLETTINLK